MFTPHSLGHTFMFLSLRNSRLAVDHKKTLFIHHSSYIQPFISNSTLFAEVDRTNEWNKTINIIIESNLTLGSVEEVYVVPYQCTTFILCVGNAPFSDHSSFLDKALHNKA